MLLLGLLTLVVFGEKFIRIMLLANIPKSKYAIHLGRDLMDRRLCVLCTSYLRFTIVNLE